jgi:hypothetical protein
MKKGTGFTWYRRDEKKDERRNHQPLDHSIGFCVGLQCPQFHWSQRWPPKIAKGFYDTKEGRRNQI